MSTISNNGVIIDYSLINVSVEQVTEYVQLSTNQNIEHILSH